MPIPAANLSRARPRLHLRLLTRSQKARAGLKTVPTQRYLRLKIVSDVSVGMLAQLDLRYEERARVATFLSSGQAVPAKINTVLHGPQRRRLYRSSPSGCDMLLLRPYLRRPASTLASIASDPLEAWIRFTEQFAASREAPTPSNLYTPNAAWEDRLLRGLDGSAAEQLNREFCALWSKVIDELAAKDIQAGPASFKGWNDGDAGFVRAVWLLARRLKPRIVVETGVAHGVTSRFILEALERNGSGELFSIDRPPIEPEWRSHIGIAVDRRLRSRWTYISGSSRRRLSQLISRLGTIDLFVHDSLHSERNVRFEIDQAFASLRPGGAIVVDDIDVNRGFFSFTQSFSGFDAIVCEAEPLRPDLRRHNEKGLFGIIVKASPGEA
jgi:Methyltransferase domain